MFAYLEYFINLLWGHAGRYSTLILIKLISYFRLSSAKYGVYNIYDNKSAAERIL